MNSNQIKNPYLDTLSLNAKFNRFSAKGPGVLLFLLLITIVSFSAWQLWRLAAGPEITLSNDLITDDYNYSNDLVFDLSGETSRVAFFYINDIEQPINTDGTFDFSLYTPRGFSTIEVRAVDRYGRTEIVSVPVYNNSPALSDSNQEQLAADAINQFHQINNS
tara:strand:- start:163 stop:651 length:489 start_codon:yes stop_codon:yes gene_type:complete